MLENRVPAPVRAAARAALARLRVPDTRVYARGAGMRCGTQRHAADHE